MRAFYGLSAILLLSVVLQTHDTICFLQEAIVCSQIVCVLEDRCGSLLFQAHVEIQRDVRHIDMLYSSILVLSYATA